MKIKKYLLKLMVVCGFVGAVSCTDDFNDLNQDPNAFNEAPIEAAFVGVVKQSYDILCRMNGDMFLHYASYDGGVGGQLPKYGFTETGVAGMWKDVFVRVLKNTEEIIVDHNEDPDYSNRMHMTKIWKAYMYSIAVSTWGPIPMSEAFGLNTSVAYDSEEQIYTEILRLLSEAVTGLEDGGDVFSVDPLFNKDVSKWRKLANTLRLKIGLRLTHGFPQLAETAVKASMANESNLVGALGDNQFMIGGITEENWNWHYNKYIFNENDNNYPFMNFSYMLHLKTYKDPRMDILVEPASVPLEIEEYVYASGSTTDTILVRYSIPKYGTTLGNSTPDAWDMDGNENPYRNTDREDYSKPSIELFFQPQTKYYINTNAETSFMKAEAAQRGWGGSKSAEAYYEDGINASFLQYQASGVDAYKAQDGIKWGTSFAGDLDIYSVTNSGISADPLDKIFRQRWLAMYWQGHDAWCMLKRTRGVTLPPHFNPDGSLVNAEFAVIPERMIYDTAEKSINSVGYGIGMDYLGGVDATTTPLKMNMPGDNLDWTTLPAAYSWDFASHWYGDSEDDLIAQGIPYEIL